MGYFTYGDAEAPDEVDDLLLLHVQITMTTKLRRGEQFLFRCDTEPRGNSGSIYWVTPHVPLRFDYASAERPALSPAWLAMLAAAAGSAAGLWLVPPPKDLGVSSARRLQRDGVLR